MKIPRREDFCIEMPRSRNKLRDKEQKIVEIFEEEEGAEEEEDEEGAEEEVEEEEEEEGVEEETNPLLNDRIIRNILKHLDLRDLCSLSQVNKAFFRKTRTKEPGKVILKRGGFKYITDDGAVLKVTDDGYFIEIRFGDLEFSFSKPIKCGNSTIYSEVWITEGRDDIEKKKEHLWKFPDVPRESLRQTTDTRLKYLYLRSERFIGKSYPWFVLNKPKTLLAMLELHSKIVDLMKEVEVIVSEETEEVDTEEIDEVISEWSEDLDSD